MFKVKRTLCKIEIFTAVTKKNAIFWDIKKQFVPHRRHITSPLQSPADCYVRFEGFTAVTMKNAVFWDVTAYGSCKNSLSEEQLASIIRAINVSSN
jgi:hypothetical protein